MSHDKLPTRIAIAGLAATSANDDEEFERIADRGR
jgi:hypothetical protein